MPRINARRATAIGLTSFATLTLIPLLAHAKPTERALLLLAAVPTAALFGYLAGYAAATATGTATHLDAAQLQAAQIYDLQLRAAQRSASTTAQPAAPVIRLISEPVPHPGTGPAHERSHLAALAPPPAEQQGAGLHLVLDPTRHGAAPGGDSTSSPHLTLITTQQPQHPTS